MTLDVYRGRKTTIQQQQQPDHSQETELRLFGHVLWSSGLSKDDPTGHN